MKIVVNTRLLRNNEIDGIGWFTYNVMQYITVNNPDIEFHFLFDSGIQDQFIFSRNITPRNLFPPAKHALLNIAWFEWSVKNYLKKTNPDLFFSPDGILSLGWHGKQYGVIHDINFVHIPEDMKWTNRKYYNHFFPKYAERAIRLATVSEYSKQDIVKTFGVEENKIDVVYNGINKVYSPVSEAEKQKTKQQYASGCRYFVCVGTLHPRKNIHRLLEAFEVFKKESGSDMKLLLVGKEMYKTSEIHEYRDQMAFKEDVVFTGRLPDEELKLVLASAYCLTLVSYFEGFGIPLIEAMQCDVPVIASNTTSFPEVAGDAALYVDPFDVRDIAGSMTAIAESPSLAGELILKGRVRANMFSWEKTADLLWRSITRVL